LDIDLRPGASGDLKSIAQIQAASPEASQWDVPAYLNYDLRVALCGENVAGFAVARRLAEDEAELLNLAVDPAFRRRGIGRRLLSNVILSYRGTLWLEVGESNLNARKFYKSLGFSEAGYRAGYYAESHERAIVMNVHS